jgi:hypothetical protein
MYKHDFSTFFYFSGPRGTRQKKIQKKDTTQVNAGFGNVDNVDIKGIIGVVQEAEHALIDSSETKDYEDYNSS